MTPLPSARATRAPVCSTIKASISRACARRLAGVTTSVTRVGQLSSSKPSIASVGRPVDARRSRTRTRCLTSGRLSCWSCRSWRRGWSSHGPRNRSVASMPVTGARSDFLQVLLILANHNKAPPIRTPCTRRDVTSLPDCRWSSWAGHLRSQRTHASRVWTGSSQRPCSYSVMRRLPSLRPATGGTS